MDIPNLSETPHLAPSETSSNEFFDTHEFQNQSLGVPNSHQLASFRPTSSDHSQAKEGEARLLNLPPELRSELGKFLKPSDLSNLSKTSKEAHTAFSIPLADAKVMTRNNLESNVQTLMQLLEVLNTQGQTLSHAHNNGLNLPQGVSGSTFAHTVRKFNEVNDQLTKTFEELTKYHGGPGSGPAT